MEDRYKGITLHHERIDWSDPELSADSITKQLCGPCKYWKAEEFEGMETHEIERDILLEAGRDLWHQDSPYGKPYYQHFLTLMAILFPKTDITNTIADAVMFFCLGLGFKKVLNLIGCQNAGKSAGAIRILFTAMYVDPYNTVGYVANPFDNAADSTVWGDTLELWEEMCEAWPHPGGKEAPSLFPDGKKYAHKKLVFIPGVPKAATVEVRNVKKVGKLKGTKTRGKEVDRGVMFVIIDEINEIENLSFLKTVENLFSQKALFVITSQNFKDEEDLGGLITAPSPKYGGPSEFNELDIDLDMFWHSAKVSITLRFDGHTAPNILATTRGAPPRFPDECDEEAGETTNLYPPRILYPYLIEPENLFILEESGGGRDSPSYASQGRSFPIRGTDQNSVLSRAKVSQSRHKDPFYRVLNVKGRVAFCDPAFGGRDSAVYGNGYSADCLVKDPTGERELEQELVIFPEPMRKLRLVKDAYYNDYWLERMLKADVDISIFTPGAEVSYEDQIAIQCAEMNKVNQIPPENFGFDFSLKPDIVSSMNKVLGFTVQAFDYNSAPHGTHLIGLNVNTEDKCKDRNTELAFLASDLFLSKQVRCGSLIDTAITQLQRTLYEEVNKKYVAEKKKDYKLRWENRSPDERDVLMGIAGMLVKRGFRKASLTQDSDKKSNKKSVYSQIQKSGAGKSRIAARSR